MVGLVPLPNPNSFNSPWPARLAHQAILAPSNGSREAAAPSVSGRVHPSILRASRRDYMERCSRGLGCTLVISRNTCYMYLFIYLFI